MKKKNRISDEITLIWLKLDDLKLHLNKLESDIKRAKEAIEYIMQRIEKLRSRYKPKTKTAIKEAENK